MALLRAPLAALFALLAAACSSGSGGTGDAHGDGTSIDARCDSAACTSHDGATDTLDEANANDLVSLAIMPANPTLTVTVGAALPTVPFMLIGTQRNGVTRPIVTGTWTLADTSLGTVVSATGVFNSNGAGGVTTLTATDGALLPAHTNITVIVTSQILGPGVTSTDAAGFGVALPAPDSATASAVIVYPLPNAVMPQNIFPPRVMWTPRATEQSTDIVRVSLSRPHAQIDWYGTSAPIGWDIDGPSWADFGASDVGQPITVTVSVLAGGMTRTSAPVTFRTINAVLGGSVYYWLPPSQSLARIDVTTATNTAFIPSPGAACIGCHAVARDGQHMMAFLEDTALTDLVEYDLTSDLTTSPAPNLGRQSYPTRQCGTYDPMATRYLMGACGRGPGQEDVGTPTEPLIPFTLVDVSTMQPVPIPSGAAGTGHDPEWSPDGTQIAFTDGSEELVLETAMPGDTFSTPMGIHVGTTETPGGIDWHPTWTPDSAWLAFQVGVNVRWTGDGTDQTGELYMLPRAGGHAVHMANASSGAPGQSFRPLFSPFDSGGDFWLLFTSTRAYGTAASGGVENEKQIWVTAVHNHPDGTRDPSEVPYWLAGQEVTTCLSPYWVPPPCRANGATCATGADCCSGECGDPDATGARSCVPAMHECRMLGESCTMDSDCCNGNVCNPTGHICDVGLPG